MSISAIFLLSQPSPTSSHHHSQLLLGPALPEFYFAQHQWLQITTIVSMRINQAKLCKTMQYHALPLSSETILDKKVLIVLLLKNSREFHFSISISRHFCFTFHFSKRVNQIWISLFTSRSKWRRFFFHFQFSKRVKLIFISLFTSRSEWKRFLFHF